MRTLLTAIALAAVGFAAHAQPSNFSDKPIRIVVPWPPGGPVDMVGRAVAAQLAVVLKQPVFVDNVAGASGVIGSQQVAKAAPDGHTLLVNAVTHFIVPYVLPKVPYDAVNDFTPIGQVSSIPLLLLAAPNAPFSNYAEFAAWSRKQPAGTSYASAGIGSTNHLAGALLATASGLDLRHIAYKGTGPALVDVIGGQVPVIFGGVNDAGKLKPIAIAADRRSSILPNVPTFAEAGVKGVVFSTWHGLYGPPNLPPAVVQKLSDALAQVTQTEEFREKLRLAGGEVVFKRPPEFATYVRAESKRMGDIVKAAGANEE